MLERFSKFIQFFRSDINSLTTKADLIAENLLAGKYTITTFLQKTRLERLIGQIADHLNKNPSTVATHSTKATIAYLQSKISSNVSQATVIKLQQAYAKVFPSSQGVASNTRDSVGDDELSKRDSTSTTASIDSDDEKERLSQGSDDNGSSYQRDSILSSMNDGFRATPRRSSDSDDELSKRDSTSTTASIDSDDDIINQPVTASKNIDNSFIVNELAKISSAELCLLLLNIFGSTTINIQEFSVKETKENTWELSYKSNQTIKYTLSTRDQDAIPGFDRNENKAVFSTLHMPKEISCVVKKEGKDFVVSFENPASAFFFEVESTAPESTKVENPETKSLFSKTYQLVKDTVNQGTKTVKDLAIQQALGSDRVGVKEINLSEEQCTISLAPSTKKNTWTDMSRSILQQDLVQTSPFEEASAFWKQLWKSYDKKNQPD